MYPFKFETYQDVKLNLAVVTLVALYVAWSAVFYVILPSEHRRALTGALGWLGHIGVQVGSLTALGIISAFLIYGIQIWSL